MKKTLRRSLWAGIAVAVGATAVAVVPIFGANAAVACAEAWSSSKIYTKDMNASYQGKNYTAKWWTQNEVPSNSGQWGVWADKGACEGGGGGGTTPPTSAPTTPPTTGPTTPPTSQPPTNPGSKWVVGYFAEWGVYGRNYHVKNVDTSGSASKVTHILYAFANTTGGRCTIGEAFPAYEKAYTADQSVDGVADTWDQPVRGNFNQLRKLKKKYPHIKVLYSVGGWSWSGGFTEAAKNPSAFADSCYNLIEDPRWADVFDGIDIDWEFPNGCGVTCDASGRDSYANLLSAVRQRFGQNYLVTSAITADASPGGKIDKTDYAAGARHLDKLFPMTYDFFGGWAAQGPTAPHSPLTSYPGIPQQGFTTEDAINKLKAQGVPASKMLLGIGFYGRGWTGVSQSAPGGSATGPAQGIEPGVQDYKVLKVECPANGTVAGTAYAHCGSNWWSYDTPQTIAGKLNWAKQQGLGGAFFWEFSGDTSNGELATAIKNNL